LKSRWPAGFSLLELLLALALSVALMALVGAAMTFYATRLETRNTEVRQVELAQSILSVIRNDLRATLLPPEFDASSLENLLTTASGGQTEQPGAGQDLSAAGLDDLSQPEAEEVPSTTLPGATANSDLSSGSAQSKRPGLIGNQTQLQFEISRLPRIEEYQQLIAPASTGQIADVPSDIKTVSYFVQAAGGMVRDPLDATDAGALFAQNLAGGTSGGLVRRALDRSLTNFSLANSGGASIAGTGDLLAREVVSIGFRYWDGLLWQIYWDSDEMGSLPLAIEVTLEIATDFGTGAAENSAGILQSGPETRRYVQIVRLPMGRMAIQETPAEMSAAGL